MARQLLDHFDHAAINAHWDHEYDIDCDFCITRPMLAIIKEAYDEGGALKVLIYSLQDGYGEPGFIPEQGYDWSGVRDSTPKAVQEMYHAVIAARQKERM